MKCVLIRCDSSLSIGSGHVMRCRNLARELQRRGAVVTFLCRRQSGDLIGLLEQEFSVLVLPELPLLECGGLAGRDLYSAWLGCTQVQDVADCLQVLSSSGVAQVDWLVVDHYGIDSTWERRFLEGLSGDYVTKLLVIDDLADRAHQADLLLDQNFFGEVTHDRYVGLLPPECQQLLGPHYALLGQEYSQLHPLVPKRSLLQRILVFFGGVDSDNLTGRTLEALADPAFSHLLVEVVLGRHSPHRQVVEDLVAKRPLTVLHDPIPSLAGLIARSDLAIGAGGATTWERACLRLPSLVVTLAENQLPFVEALHHEGYIELLGQSATVSVEQIRSALLARTCNPVQGGAGGNLTDGFGTYRLLLAMFGPTGAIRLRPADQSDDALLRRWANDPQFPVNSFVQHSIPPSGNNIFSDKGSTVPSRLLMIAETADGCPIGQIGLLRPSLTENGSGDVTFDLWLDRCALGFGLSDQLLRLAFQLMEKNWAPDIKPLIGEANTNKVRNACFGTLGNVQDSIPLPFTLASDCKSLAISSVQITLLSDPGSWLNQFLPELIKLFWQRGHSVRWIHHPAQLAAGDVCFLLSCGRLLSVEQLSLHAHNLVVHASDLPKGQGWSPMSWQILEGVDQIPVTLFEAVAELDNGPIYLQQQIQLCGHELVDEWRSLLAQATQDLCLLWLDRYHEVVAKAQPQLGDSTYYDRRRPVDSKLDPERSLSEQFNLLRVVDNDSYPAFFLRGNRKFYFYIEGESLDV